jgi:hypothetical protein
MSTTEPNDFYEQVKFLQSLGYRERRRVLWHKHKPRLRRFLYKFRAFDALDATSVERMRDIVLQCRLRLSPPGELNDPFDSSVKIVIDGTPAAISERLRPLLEARGFKWEERLRETRRLLLNLDEVTLRAQEAFRASIRDYGVCSFGGNPRSILAWSHYALDHRGIALQFETAQDIAVFGQALPVNYSNDYPVVNWLNETEHMVQKLLRKYQGWEYEDELRIVLPEEARRFIKFRPIALSGIIIGCSASEKTIERLNEIIAERKSMSLPTPILYRAFTHQRRYRLVIKKEKPRV